MNALRPFPRPVAVAFPPNATVIAVRTALLPPTPHVKEHHAYSQGLRTSVVTYESDVVSVDTPEYAMLRTDDEVDLWPEFERKKLVAHKMVHLNGFNNAKFCGALSVGTSGWKDWALG